VGIGNVGRRVAELCRGLFGMQVIASDPYLDDQTIAARGAVKVTLDELLRRADFVSINCPLDDSTRGMIGAREFALMPPHAYFITTARGFIHDERALPKALRANQIAAAALPSLPARLGIVRQYRSRRSHPAILAGVIWRANYTRRRRWTSLPDDLQ